MSDTGRSVSTDDWSHFENTPSASEAGGSDDSHDGLKTPVASEIGSFGGVSSDKSDDGAKTPTKTGPIRIVDFEVNFEYATFPQVPVTDSFDFKQEPGEWHNLTSHFHYPSQWFEAIRVSIDRMAQSENGAGKLALVLVFSVVYRAQCEHFWFCVQLTATEKLFKFVGAPDVYFCKIDGYEKCANTWILRNSTWFGSADYSIARSGEVERLNRSSSDRLHHRKFEYLMEPERKRDWVYIGSLPDLTVNVL